MKTLTWQGVVLLAVLGGVAVALAALTPWGPAEILTLVGILGGIGTGSMVGNAVTGRLGDRMDQIHAETTAQTPIMETVAKRVNGELDQRIANAMEEAAEMGAARALSALASKPEAKIS